MQSVAINKDKNDLIQNEIFKSGAEHIYESSSKENSLIYDL